MTIARSRGRMCMRFGLRCPPRGRAKCDENSGCAPGRQESYPPHGNRRNVFSTGSAIAVPKLPRLAYAFSMRYVLGLDGGGTKTECVLMDESRQVVTSSRGGPSNPIRVGFADASGAKASAGRVRKRT